MRIARTIADMRAACRAVGALALVPTMGALHAGHVSLLHAARARSGTVAASIFVNPLQFAPGEDLEKYPRTFAEDCALLEREGVDLLFAPTDAEMYPHGRGGTFVEVPGIGDRLDGASRPGHFRGVATVVAKLFGIVGPETAFFGQKDAAQVAVLRAMVRDLDLPVTLVVCPTVREPDGLAMSSRNRYLSADERVQALALSRGLTLVEAAWRAGEMRAGVLRELLFEAMEGLKLDYAEVVNADTLEPVECVCRGALVAVAAYVGATRLIDNVVLEHVALENVLPEPVR